MDRSRVRRQKKSLTPPLQPHRQHAVIPHQLHPHLSWIRLWKAFPAIQKRGYKTPFHRRAMHYFGCKTIKTSLIWKNGENPSSSLLLLFSTHWKDLPGQGESETLGLMMPSMSVIEKFHLHGGISCSSNLRSFICVVGLLATAVLATTNTKAAAETHTHTPKSPVHIYACLAKKYIHG